MTNPPAVGNVSVIASNAVKEQRRLRALLDQVEAAFVRSLWPATR